MWRLRSERSERSDRGERRLALAIGLSHAQVMWQSAGSDVQAAPLSAQGGRFAEIAATIEASALPPRLAAVQVVAGSSVARHWLQTAPPGLRSLSELQALVQSRADQLFGGDRDWMVAADWHATRPFLCAALPRDVDRLTSAIASARGATPHLATSLSLALARHARRLPADGWSVLHEPEALHLLYFAAGRLDSIRIAAVAPDLQGTALERETAAEVARSSALAGGLPIGPLTLLAIGGDLAATQAGAALHLATLTFGGRAT